MRLTVETFIPAPNLLLVEEEAKADKTEGGVFLPDNVEEESPVRFGRVVLGKLTGAVVAYPSYATMAFKLADRDDLRAVFIHDLYGADVAFPENK